MRCLRIVGAASPGPVTPESDNAPWQGRVEGEGKAGSSDCAEDAADRKRVATLAARVAELEGRLRRAGWLLQRDPQDGAYIVSAGRYRRRLPNLDRLRDFAYCVCDETPTRWGP